MLRSTVIAFALSVFTSAAFAEPLSGASTRTSEHSGAATGHASAALATGASVISAAPVITAGTTLKISGAALASVGDGAKKMGEQVIEGEAPPQESESVTQPDGPPSLD